MEREREIDSVAVVFVLSLLTTHRYLRIDRLYQLSKNLKKTQEGNGLVRRMSDGFGCLVLVTLEWNLPYAGREERCAVTLDDGDRLGPDRMLTVDPTLRSERMWHQVLLEKRWTVLVIDE